MPVCKDCPDRHQGCHAECERYLAEHEENLKIYAEREKNVKVTSASIDLCYKRQLRMRGGKKK